MRRPLRTLAVIPARGGSTRIPRKNLAPLDGTPLLVHTLRAAQAARSLDAVVVSTDDAEIAACAEQHGAEVVWRPAALATAQAPSEPALRHAILEVEARRGERIEVAVMLQATSPLRGADRIEEAVALLRRTGCDAVTSVVADRRYYFLGDLLADGRFLPGFDPEHRLRTQEIVPRYQENGAVYAMTRAQIIERGCRLGADTRAVVMREDESLDIDDPLDLAICEHVLRARRAAGAAGAAAAAA